MSEINEIVDEGGGSDSCNKNCNGLETNDIFKSTTASPQNSDHLNEVATTNVKRKSLILCDIKDNDSSSDDEDFVSIENTEEIEDNIDHGVNDDDNELMCNSILLENQCCDTIKVINNSGNNNNKNKNNTNYLNNQNNIKKLNQTQIEYDSQGEEETCVDSSMESAIEISSTKDDEVDSKKVSIKKDLNKTPGLNKTGQNLITSEFKNNKNKSLKYKSKSVDDNQFLNKENGKENNDEKNICENGNKNENNLKNELKLRKNNLKNDLNVSTTNLNQNQNSSENNVANANVDEIKSANELVCYCCNRDTCLSLKDILKAFNAPISEEQAWALIFQIVKLYRDSIMKAITNGLRCCKVNVPNSLDNLSIHLDGSVHINNKNGGDRSAVTSHKKILHKIGHVIFLALDYNLQEDEDCIMSPQLEHLISQMTVIDDIDDEGIERDSEDCEDLDDIIEICIPRACNEPEVHYKAVCRAFATEAFDLTTFLEKVFKGDTHALRIKADAVDSNVELDKLSFNDWARFWMQVVDELRQGVRLKRKEFRDVTRTPVEYELTPYEILMGDIRAKKYSLRKVMVNGDIPPRVKKDAHAVILEFIRSRPPLKKASERKLLPPVKRNPSPREQLMDSIRKGRPLKPVPQPTLKNRLLPSTSQQYESLVCDGKISSTSNPVVNNMSCSSSTNLSTAGSSKSSTTNKHLPKSNINHMMHDPYSNFDEVDCSRTSMSQQNQQQQQYSHHYTQQHQKQQQPLINNISQPRMPAYPISGYIGNKDCAASSSSSSSTSNKTAIRRTTYDLATQCESRKASLRRHTIVGCHANAENETQSQPSSTRSDVRQPGQNYNKYSNSNYSTGNNTYKYQTKSNQSGDPTPTISTTNLSSSNIQQQQQSSSTSYTKNSSGGGSGSGDTSSTDRWSDKSSDRLSLTLEEIVHIRSVMTKAELEGLPVGVRVKEEVEKRKICFLCLRTRFTIFVWGIQCKLCQRTVCSKCYSKMRIPTEHFRNVPVVLLSPSLIGSPASSSAGSPSHSHHGSISHSNNSIDENFPKTLMERLMRSESDRKARNSVGSAPSSPRNQRSNMSTPGVAASQNDLMTKSSDSHTLLTNGYNKENVVNGGIAANRQVTGVMSRSMEGPRSLPMQSPGRAHSNNSTLERKNRFARALTLSSSSHGAVDFKDNLRGEMMAVCNDCRDLVLEIIRSSRQTRSSARNQALKNMTLDISPVYK